MSTHDETGKRAFVMKQLNEDELPVKNRKEVSTVKAINEK